MKICCVVVTYADRSLFVTDLVAELMKLPVEKIVIVDNGSTEESLNNLRSLAMAHSSVVLEEIGYNSGSAHGFRRGIEVALQQQTDFIWILDDDNLPGQNSLKALQDAWFKIQLPEKEKSVALTSYRKGRLNFQKAVETRDAAAVLPPRNSFMGFHWKAIFSRLFATRSFANSGCDKIISIDASAYGGLFFHRAIVDRIGLPDESYVLYMDDFDYTFKIKLSGGALFLVPASELTDREESYYLPAKKGIFYHSLLEAKSDSVAYYTCRNVIHFSCKFLTTNKISYAFNKLIFVTYITLAALVRRKAKRLRTIKEAVGDGQQGNLGLNPYYPLK